MTQDKGTETNASIGEFFHALREMRGIKALDRHLLVLLRQMETIPEDVQKFLCLCFSLWDDGNAFVSLKEESFLAKWGGKWEGLKTLRNGDPDADKAETERLISAVEGDRGIERIVREGIDWFKEPRDFVASRAGDADPDAAIDRPLAKVGEKGDERLYFSKYFRAKRRIETKMKEAQGLFEGGSASEDEIGKCIEKVRALTGGMKLNHAQAEAVVRGQKGNLVVTGGPGTGKTTVVFYVLWELLSKRPETLKWPIYLAAPSGKAAERMSESLRKGLEKIERTDENEAVREKMASLQGTTIHRLLKYNPSEDGFSRNGDNPFPAESIFVVDEASMIDLCLFASLLEAIPKDAKLFVLGDPYQLPSVDAGAVLGEILEEFGAVGERSPCVRLVESNRFADDSPIGALAKSVKECAVSASPKWAGDCPVSACPDGNPRRVEIRKGNAVSRFEPEMEIDGKTAQWDEMKRDGKKETVERIVKDWLALEASEPQGDWDFRRLRELAERIDPAKVNRSAVADDTREKCARIWALSLRKRMLSAEREGLLGVMNLNKVACEALKELAEKDKEDEKESAVGNSGKNFPGQLMMIVRNLHAYGLYNGDAGIVLFKDNAPHLLLKKKNPNGGEFSTYPLALLPSDAVETAFAITVHKSQGSEYDHVTMFLPTQIGHPLLNNQILYTGVTRAKKSVEIIATEEAFKYACETVIKRDTGIEI